MTFPYSHPRPATTRLKVGAIVYPWGNKTRARINRHMKVRGETFYRLVFIEDDIATIHWYMQLVIFPEGCTMDLKREQISDHPQR